MVLVFTPRPFETTKRPQRNVKKKKRTTPPAHNIFSVSARPHSCAFTIRSFVVVQNDLGIINGGLVYALYDHEPNNSLDESMKNELTFKDGDQLRVLRRGDENEIEWWWAKHETSQQEGYIPRNYLGV